TYNLDQTSRYSANYDQMTANKIDVTNEACEEYSQEVLGFSGVTASEDDPDSPELDPSYYDPEGDILSLEVILNSDPLTPLSNHKQSVPSFKEELKACEAKTIKSSIDEPPEVEKLLDAGLIYPISDSPWVSPVHCVPKKGGFTVVTNEENELIPTRLVTGWRVCIDYRKLNEATRKDHFPLPFMDPRDPEKTTFTCPYGTFAYRRMPFGLCNAPDTFQRCMLAIFHDMVEKTMEVFMDDFSVFGNSFKNCLSHLDKMLQRCEDTKLCLNWEKSHFMVKEGIVLGHKISKNRIEVDKAKINVIAKLPHPTTVKGYETLLSQLEIHGAGVLHEDASQNFDDLYNNLRVFEHDVKGTTASSSNTQNVAFMSADNTSSTNDVSTADSVSSPSVSKSQKEGSSSYTDEVIHFFFANQAKGNQDSKRRDVGYNGNKARDNDRRPAYQDDSKALVTIDGEDINWSRHVEEDAQNYAMMAYSSSNSGSDNKEYESDSDNDSVSNVQEDKEKPSFAFTDSVKHVKPSKENVKETGLPNHNLKIEKQDRNGHTRKGLGYAFTRKACFVCGTFSHLIRDYDFYEKRMAKQVELTKSKNKVTGQRETRPVWNNAQRVNHQNKFVPSVLLTKTGKFLVNAARQNYSSQVASTSTTSKVNTARPFVIETRPKRYFYRTHSPNKRAFHNKIAQRTHFINHKVNTVNTSLSVVKGNRDTAVRASSGCNWRNKRDYWNKVFNYKDDPHRALKDKGIINSGCSRHMTWNKAHLIDYQEFKGGSVAFGGSNGRITGKGKIKAGELYFDDVYYVEELKHYNLFYVS
nr:reverse transcriptase domain-containing protein [Tanacetum cinerariifolium]